MKYFYLIFIISSLFLIGCSSTYRISDFPSKDKFYGDFNKFADNKSLKVTLTNDSSFTAEGKTEISDDTLIILMNIQKGRKTNVDVAKDIYMSLPLNKVKRISYKNHWLGIPYGFLGGAVIGLGIGGGIASYDAHHNLYDKDTSFPTIVFSGMMLGSLGGTIVGWIIGWDYTYQFNP